MARYDHIQKLQQGGTFQGVAAPLQSEEEVYIPEARPELYFQDYKLPEAELPKLDMDRLMKVSGPSNDVQQLQNEVLSLQNDLNQTITTNPLYMTTKEGKAKLSRLQQLLTVGVNRVEEQENYLKQSESYMKESGNRMTYALTTSGRYVGLDAQRKLRMDLTEKDLASGQFSALTNVELAQMRREHPELTGNGSIYGVISNTMGMEKVAEALEKNFANLGTDTNGNTVFDGINAQGGDNDDVYSKTTWKTSSNARAIKAASDKLYMKLSPEMKNTLRVNSFRVVAQKDISNLSQEEIDKKINDVIVGLVGSMADSHKSGGTVYSTSFNENPFNKIAREREKDSGVIFTPLQAALVNGEKVDVTTGNGYTTAGVRFKDPDRDFNDKQVLAGQTALWRESDTSKMHITGLGKPPSPEVIHAIKSYGDIQKSTAVALPVDGQGNVSMEFSKDKEENASLQSRFSGLQASLAAHIGSGNNEARQDVENQMAEMYRNAGMEPPTGYQLATISEIIIPAVGELDGKWWWPDGGVNSNFTPLGPAAVEAHKKSLNDKGMNLTNIKDMPSGDAFTTIQVTMPVNGYTLSEAYFANKKEVTPQIVTAHNPRAAVVTTNLGNRQAFEK